MCSKETLQTEERILLQDSLSIPSSFMDYFSVFHMIRRLNCDLWSLNLSIYLMIVRIQLKIPE